jgi:hypothetical protein
VIPIQVEAMAGTSFVFIAVDLVNADSVNSSFARTDKS